MGRTERTEGVVEDMTWSLEARAASAGGKPSIVATSRAPASRGDPARENSPTFQRGKSAENNQVRKENSVFDITTGQHEAQEHGLTPVLR